MRLSLGPLVAIAKKFFLDFRGGARNDDEGRIALSSAYSSVEDVNSDVGLLDTEIPSTFRRPGKTRWYSSINQKFLWKIFGITLALVTALYSLKAFRRALDYAANKPKQLPAFGTSLGCSTASYVHNKTFADRNSASFFDVSGDGVGTIIIADGAPDSTDIVYHATVRATKRALLDEVTLERGSRHHQGEYPIRLRTPTLKGIDKWHCVRYDLTIFMPPVRTSLKVLARTLAHVGFAPGTTIGNTTSLTVSLQAPDARNVLALSSSVLPWSAHYEAYRGFIDGEASIVNDILLETRLADGVANVIFVPSRPTQKGSPARLWTVGGSGASNFVYSANKAFQRNITAFHAAGGTTDMTLTYRDANINGVVGIASNTYTLTGAHAFREGEGEKWGTGWNEANWTHYVGNPDGGDFIQVEHHEGWTGLYF